MQGFSAINKSHKRGIEHNILLDMETLELHHIGNHSAKNVSGDELDRGSCLLCIILFSFYISRIRTTHLNKMSKQVRVPLKL